jgi:hypothetical protein
VSKQQCSKCTRFFDPEDPKDPCWCAQSTPPDTFVDRVAAFFSSCYSSVLPSRAEVLVDFVVCQLDEIYRRYGAVATAYDVASTEELRASVRQALPKLAVLTVLPPIIDEEISCLMGHPVQPQEPVAAQRWIQDVLLDHPMTLSVALQEWLNGLGFPEEFCNNLTLEYSVELAEWILGARRG